MSPESKASEPTPSEPSSARAANDPVRVSRRRRWRADIRSGETKDIAPAFERDGVPGPDVVWSPRLADCTTPQTRFLLEHWAELAKPPSLPDVAAIDPIEFAPALGFVHLVEPMPSEDEFVYRIFATSIADLSGGDFSGRRMTAMQASDYVVDFGIASCGAVCDAKKPLLTRRRPARATFTAYWERLMLPFAGRDGAIERLLIGVVPVSEAGDVIAPRKAL